MITFTKEQLIASAHARIEFAEMMLAGELEPLKERTWSIELELARIALASLEAEPVAWLLSGGGAKNNVSFDSGNAYADPLREVTPLYTAPPAPVSVPAAMEMDDDFDSAFEHGKAVGWNAYRAAMLQSFGNSEQLEPVTTAYKLRDAVETIRNSGIAIDAEKIFAERDALNAPDCWCRTCRPITLTDMRFVVCPDCGNKRCPHANDHRNACSGSNEPGQEGSAYPAAPQQEVKP
ncbi:MULTISPECIES: hypothetical protein [Enterobacter cloacae complex]|nr:MULTISPECIES: hypothetical protein [Enterobacter cloacae complex]KJL68455.1 hypothetical protein SS38_19285 [Enterobacter hormaechei subsp. xiangfangensis]KJM74430.1 hypothetical protein SS16_17190 [Enterobacter hormaechei subsp. xiangfangensis]MBO2807973.1 hypothetical protein [Enterobacter hormaechei]MCL8109772.1 hypothetical protein [Enterobacter hormaechei]MCM8255499.1 hypothetical protein [Enterobacter hormaechei]